MLKALFENFRTVFASKPLPSEEARYVGRYPNDEAKILAKLRDDLVLVANKFCPDWQAISLVATPGDDQVKIYGYVYTEIAQPYNIELLSNNTAFLFNHLKKKTLLYRKDWKRVYIGIKSGFNEFSVSYDFGEIDPWNVFSLENEAEIRTIIQCMRPL